MAISSIVAQTSGGHQKIFDVSFAGSTIVIDGALINEFMDDANPIDIQDTDTCNIEWSCNGRMIRTIKPSAVMMSITVIPGSASDHALRSIWVRGFNNGGTVDPGVADKAIKCVVSVRKPGFYRFVFTGGTCVSGAAALSANGQGKMGGNTYTFAFENIE